MSKADTFKDSKVRHGTQSGWRKHMDLGERPCDPCYRAKAEYDENRLKLPEQKRKNRLTARAQFRAYQALSHRYPDEYKRLYEGFRDKLMKEEL